ncbi:MAG: NAD(P)H-dependent oxidoreductase subunit E [Chloroflexi bacterium]|nr:NAD(P)H-dependent oxidoreductase subunit E [Chloroflexota bacterium]
MEREELRPILREKFPPQRTYLLPALHFLQEELGHLPEWALQAVAWHLRTPASVVYGAATSYTELRIQQPNQHLVRVCTGLSCWYGGARELLSQLSDKLNAVSGEADTECPVTLKETPCAYRCSLAPLVEVDGVWQARELAAGVLEQLDGWLRQ